MNLLKLAFLDTNALVKLFTFWEACQIAKVSLSSVSGWQSLRQDLANATTPLVSSLESADFDSVQMGYRCFQRLDAAKTDFGFLCCQVSRSELHHVLLSATASEELHRHRVPRSLANKRPLIVHQLALPSKAYSEIEIQIDSFFDTMRNVHSINIKTLEDPANGYNIDSEEIFETARKIWSHVLMETMDSYIFAAAIQAEADYLMTSDGAFRNTVNGLQQGQGEWQVVASALKVALGSSQSSSFPKGIGLTSTLT